MKTILTSTIVLLLFGFGVKAQDGKSKYNLKTDTVLNLKKFEPMNMYIAAIVKKPGYSINNPAPVKLPNGYIKTADTSVPIPTHQLLMDSIGIYIPFKK